MPRGHWDRIADILAAVADIQADTQGMNLAIFEKNPTVIRSVLYFIGAIGEAIKAIAPAQGRTSRYPLARHSRNSRPDRPRIFPHQHTAYPVDLQRERGRRHGNPMEHFPGGIIRLSCFLDMTFTVSEYRKTSLLSR